MQLLFVTVLECKDERKKDLLIPAFNTAMILASVAADTNASQELYKLEHEVYNRPKEQEQSQQAAQVQPK